LSSAKLVCANIVCVNGVLVLSGSIDYESVINLSSLGTNFINQTDAKSLSVDWAEVTFANSVALALLLQWMRQAEAVGKLINSINVPDFLMSQARLCQLEFLFV
jgi:phospholipid transport system transporter-binding protein